MENKEIEQPTESISELKIKNEFTDVVDFCLNRLKMNNHYVVEKKSATISQRATMFGHKLYGQMMEIMEEMMFDTQQVHNPTSVQEEVFNDDQETENAEYLDEYFDQGPPEFNLQVPSEISTDDNDSDYRPEDDVELAPYREELMALEYNKTHRMWLPENIHYLVDSINSGREEKLKQIQNLVYKKCLEHKKQNKKVSSKLIRQWAIEIKERISRDLNFHASLKWLVKFKKTFGITGVSPDLKIGEQNFVKDDKKGFLHLSGGKSGGDERDEEEITDIDDQPLSKRIKRMDVKSGINIEKSSSLINAKKAVGSSSTSGWMWLKENPYLYDNPSLAERGRIFHSGQEKTPIWAVKMLQDQSSYGRFRSSSDYQ